MNYHKIAGYKKTRSPQQEILWKYVSDFWIKMTPCSVNYPLKRNGQERYEGSCYEAVLPYDEKVFEVDKWVFQGKDLFFLNTPKAVGDSDLTFKVFSWNTAEEEG
jgi:hypothetical protein